MPVHASLAFPSSALPKSQGFLERLLPFVLCLVALSTGVPSAFAFSTLPTTTALAVTLTRGGTLQSTVPQGTALTLTASVTAGGTAVTVGQVVFCADSNATHCSEINLVGKAQLNGAGVATLHFTPGPGAHTYEAIYLGNKVDSSSKSTIVAIGVAGVTDSAVLVATVDSAANNILRATLQGSTAVAPSGTVTYLDTTDANYVIGTATLGTPTRQYGLASYATTLPFGTAISAAVADFNGDGILDIAGVNRNINMVTIYLGQGDGSFTQASSLGISALAGAVTAGDFNEDGKLDLAIGGAGGVVNILLGQGDGTFVAGSTLSVGSGSFSLVVADFDGDGHDDLAQANESSNDVTILLGHGDGTFSATLTNPATSVNPRVAAVGDFNGDGKPDLVISTGGGGGAITVLLGNGDGTFTPAPTPSIGRLPVSVAVGDFDGDGKLDVAVGDDSSDSVGILKGNGDGTFTALTTVSPAGFTPTTLLVGDFDGDGKLDIGVGNDSDRTVTVLLGNRDGTFSTGATQAAYSGGGQLLYAAVGDFNGDGKTDLVAGSTGTAPLDVMLSTSSFSSVASIPVISPVGTGRHAIVATYPGDGLYGPATSAPLNLTASPASTSLALVATPNTSLFGQQVVLTATLAPYTAADHSADGETITFKSGGGIVGTSALHNGVATLNVTSLAAGMDQLSATFSGDTNFTTSSSTAMFYTVLNGTTLALTVTPSTSTFGTAVAMTATLSPYTAAGRSTDGESISFYAGAVLVGMANLSGGGATLNSTTISAGAGNLTAKYAGDTYYASATSAGVAYRVNTAAPSITWNPPTSANYTGVAFGMLRSASSTVPGVIAYTLTPSGSATAPLLATTILPVGTYILAATLTPTDTANYTTVTVSSPFTVNPATLTLIPANATRIYGIANPSLAGTVLGALNGDQFIASGTTSATPSSLVGSYPITYTLTGANLANYTYALPSATLTITQASSALTWANPAAISYGTALSSAQLNATGSVPGTITYSKTSGTVLNAGSYTLSASFVPTDATDYKPITANVSLLVTKAPLVLIANNINRTFGTANPLFTGSITGAVNGDVFTETFSTVANAGSIVGSYPIIPAVSGGSLSNYSVSTTNGLLTVSQAGTATTFALSNSNLTLTATVTSLSSGAPTGMVGFYVGQTLAGTSALVNGAASFTMASFPAGNVTLTAEYGGDANFTQSSSPALFILAVTPAASTLTVSSMGTVSDSFGLAVAPGYVGMVQFSCSGLPKGTTCTFSPASQTFSGTSSTANVTLSVQTGTAVAGLLRNSPGINLAGLLGLPGIFAFAFYKRNRTGRPFSGIILTLFFVCCLGLGLVGCAGGASSAGAPTTPTSTTPSGSSAFQVLATGSGGISQTTTLTLNVQ